MEINFYWRGFFEMPDLCRECIYSWREHGHTPVLWSHDNVKLSGIESRDAAKIFTPIPNELPAIVADGFRYKLLADYGGVWADCDILCLKKLPDFSGTSFASELAVDGSNAPTNCFIYAEPDCPVMQALWEAYQRVPRPMTWGDTGPTLVNEIMKSHEANIYEFKFMCPVAWWEYKNLGINDFSLDLSHSFGLHFWHELWKRNGGFETAGHRSPIWTLINKRTH